MKKLLLIIFAACIIHPSYVTCSSGSAAAAGLFGFGLGMFTGAVAAHDHHCCHHCRPLFNSLSDENDLLRASLHETKKLVRSLKEDNRELVIDNRENKEEIRELEKEIAELRQQNKILRRKLNREKISEAGVRFGIAIDAKG